MLKIDRNLRQWTARCASDADKIRSLHEKEEKKVQGIGISQVEGGY